MMTAKNVENMNRYKHTNKKYQLNEPGRNISNDKKRQITFKHTNEQAQSRRQRQANEKHKNYT